MPLLAPLTHFSQLIEAGLPANTPGALDRECQPARRTPVQHAPVRAFDKICLGRWPCHDADWRSSSPSPGGGLFRFLVYGSATDISGVLPWILIPIGVARESSGGRRGAGAMTGRAGDIG